MQNNPYDDIPIFYCTNCLSLKIMGSNDILYCDECGDTDIKECSIKEWVELKKEREQGEEL